MYFHEVLPLIHLAVSAAGGGAVPEVETINAFVVSSTRDVCF
jgi:hypothetical protein